jgi:hypothetical protein
MVTIAIVTIDNRDSNSVTFGSVGFSVLRVPTDTEIHVNNRPVNDRNQSNNSSEF